MKRLRPIKLYGNTIIIKFEKIDLKDLNLKIGDLVDISKLEKVGK